MGLVHAKALWDRHRSYGAMRDELLGLGFRPQAEGGESPRERIALLEGRITRLTAALQDIAEDAGECGEKARLALGDPAN
jgi:hypothetical protein